MDKTVLITIKRIVVFIGVYSSIFIVLSCKKDLEKKEIIYHKEKTTERIEDDSVSEFPKTGNKISDFVILPYEIQYQVEGLLDNDKLEDVVIVLHDKNDKSSRRPTLVLLKQPQGGYKLQEISWVAIGPEYTTDDYKIYDTEDISLANKELIFSMYSIGPSGNKETVYKFVQKELILINVNTYNMGAGGQSTMDYNLLTGDVIFEEVNTMVDSMPTTTTNKVLKLNHKIFFDNDDPENVLDTIFKIM
jgi:hypothetical protein